MGFKPGRKIRDHALYLLHGDRVLVGSGQYCGRFAQRRVGQDGGKGYDEHQHDRWPACRARGGGFIFRDVLERAAFQFAFRLVSGCGINDAVGAVGFQFGQLVAIDSGVDLAPCNRGFSGIAAQQRIQQGDKRDGDQDSRAGEKRHHEEGPPCLPAGFSPASRLARCARSSLFNSPSGIPAKEAFARRRS